MAPFAKLRLRLDSLARNLSGARGVWWSAGVVGLLMLGLLAWQALLPRPYYTGTDSVGVRSIVATVDPHHRLCVDDLELPARTGGVSLALFAKRPSIRVEIDVHTGAGEIRSDAAGAPGPGGRVDVVAPIPLRPATPAAVPATICLTPRNGAVDVGGMASLQGNQVPARLDGRPLQSRVTVYFVPRLGAKRSLISSLGAIFARAALFRPGWVGSWTYPVLIFGLLPAIVALALVLLARAAAGRDLRLRRRRVPIVVVVALIGFVNAASWSLITPAFNTPDEPDHFAYAQYLATTGRVPAKAPDALAPFSTEELLGLEAVNVYSVVALADARPPWLASSVTAWEQRAAGAPEPAGNGGGYTPAAAPHDPPYYALAAIAYDLVSSRSVFSQLWMMRLVSALLGAIVAACAAGVVREIVPRQPLAAAAAGLLVAFQPMFSFIAGGVNDDNGVNAAAAIVLYLLIRALRRGLRPWSALALGVAIVLTPLMKETGYEIYPAVAFGLLAIAWRHRRRLRPAGWAALAAGLLVTDVAWRVLKHSLYPTLAGHSAAAGGISATGAVTLAEHMPGRFAVYLWELFLPRLPFMSDLFPPGWPFYHIYLERGFGSFGWYAFDFPRWVYLVIVVVMVIVGVLALTAAWRERIAARARIAELALVILFPVCVLVAVEAAYFAPNGGRSVVAEQGRYIFPAIAALAALALGGTFGLGRRWQAPLATTLVVGMIGLSYAGQLLTLVSFYT